MKEIAWNPKTNDDHRAMVAAFNLGSSSFLFDDDYPEGGGNSFEVPGAIGTESLIGWARSNRFGLMSVRFRRDQIARFVTSQRDWDLKHPGAIRIYNYPGAIGTQINDGVV